MKEMGTVFVFPSHSPAGVDAVDAYAEMLLWAGQGNGRLSGLFDHLLRAVIQAFRMQFWQSEIAFCSRLKKWRRRGNGNLRR